MDGLIIKSPYIEDILRGIKKIEVRGSNTNKRGMIVLLQSGTGMALGTVEIYDVKEMSLDDYNNWDYRKDNKKLPDDRLPYKKTYAYLLKNPKKFSKPIGYKHPKGAIVWVKLNNDFLNDKL